MCGLVGFLRFDSGSGIAESVLRRMRDRMTHRGPDGAGIWCREDGGVGLAHRRLSIIDPAAAANQPMSSDDGKVQLVYNGEIYNHAEIRAELESLGHRFRTDHSDTEALLRAYLQWGRDCLTRFHGMFAFALWDDRSNELWLVRDRIGIKPLYYSRSNGRLTFASEIKALLADPEQRREVNEEAMFAYFSFLVPPAPQTMFAGIEKLPGGCWLLARPDGNVSVRRYWDALDHRIDLTGYSDAAIAEQVLERLTEAVQRRMVSDVPVGVFLSGGIDSSTNAALFARHSNSPVKTFSIGYDQDYGSYRNELDEARRVVSELGTEHHELRLTESDLIDFLPKMVQLQDEPIGDPVCVPVYYVSKLARDHGVVVCQVGEGADELFCGYPRWHQQLKLQGMSDRYPVPNAVRRLGLWALRQFGKDAHLPYDWLDRSTRGEPVFWGGAESLSHATRSRLLSPRLRQHFAGWTSWDVLVPIHQRFQSHGLKSRLAWMTYLDLNYRLPELLLMRVDKMSMGVSLECRVPFLDHELVELAMSIDEAVLTRGAVAKTVLKQAVHGLIPQEIIDRPKQGFGVPVHDWLVSGLGTFAQDTLRSFVRKTDLLDAGGVDALLQSGQSMETWTLLNLALWWEENFA